MRRKAKGRKRDETTEVDDVVKRKRDKLKATHRRRQESHSFHLIRTCILTSGGNGPAVQGSWNQRKIGWTVEGGGHDNGKPLIDDGFLGCETDRLQGLKGAQG